MSYPEFRQELFNALEQIIPQEVTIRPVQAEKLNSYIRYGIAFDKADVPFSPTIYLEPFYRSFRKGKSLDALAEELLACYKEEAGVVPQSICRLQSFESARQDIFCKLIHIEENLRLLQNTPHTTYLDFAIVAYFEVESDEIYKGSVLITQQYIDMWQITEEELLSYAVARTKEAKGVLFRPMAEVLSKYICENDGEVYERANTGMFVLTNTEKYLGAVLIYYPEVLQMVWEHLRADFYLLPASVHEWVIVPAAEVEEAELLLTMVRDINHAEVLEEEVLSNNIYLYSESSQDDKITCISGINR